LSTVLLVKSLVPQPVSPSKETSSVVWLLAQFVGPFSSGFSAHIPRAYQYSQGINRLGSEMSHVRDKINLAHKFPVKTNVPEPRRKLRRPKKQGAFVSLRHDIRRQHGHFVTMALLALHTMPPGAWLLLFIHQWIDIFFRITMVCHSFWVYLLKGNYFPKSSSSLILSQSASLNIASLSLPEWVMIWDRYTVNHFHY
jgi:hypothetical protein